MGISNSKNKLKEQSFPSTQFETGSLVHYGLHWANWPMSFWGVFCLCCLSPLGALGCATVSSFMWVLWIQILVLTLACQVLYPLDHPLSLILGFFTQAVDSKLRSSVL